MRNSIRIEYREENIPIGRITLQEDHELVDLFVEPGYRRKGIGSMLARLGEAVARDLGYPRVFATTAMDNEASKAVWRGQDYDPYFKYEKRFDEE